MHSSTRHGAANARIPVTVITGPAGAGKSSLVRHLLESASGRRVLALVADDAVVDGALVAARDGPRMTLNNGSCCVVVEDDAATALTDLAGHADRPDHVLIDAPGVADPRRWQGLAYMPGYALDGTVLVLDVARVQGDDASASPEELGRQVRATEVVLLNKLDLATDRVANEAQRLLGCLAPTTAVLRCTRGRIHPALLLGPSDGAGALDTRATEVEWGPDYIPTPARGGTGGAAAARAGALEHRSWCLTHQGAVDGRDFRGWAQRLPPMIVSGRGSVHLRDEPHHRYVFRLLGGRWHLERGTPWGAETPSTRVVLAGVSSPHHAPRPPRRVPAAVAESSSALM